MDINDYLLDQAGHDWAAMLADWTPPLPPSLTLWLVNRFGDAFVVDDDGAINLLDVGAGTFVRLAADRDQFAERLGLGDNASNWLLIPLVDACREAGMTPGPGQCYGFKVPPMLGGAYEVANIEPTDLSIHYSLLADIHKRTKDLPDGTQIKSVMVD
jgi:hypothetical protein